MDEAITTHLLNLTKNRYTKWKNKCKTLENDLLLANVQLDNKWGINVLAGHAHRVRAHGLWETCFKGDAKDWYERALRRKN
ncbi:hypothetical protein F8M41_024900 [Gigaspora margarita]|uniref:Uncharacterized protein n=1 Tax=Gigaspora margarita TaxID=4874 RepID=A0A8H4ABA1_GIGMA|nr:hypothetical protein F8M41_024900 [Gigaspora margarita]